MTTYQGLHHENTLGPHATQERIHIDCVLSLHSLQHAIQQDEGARPTHTSTAVYQHGRTILLVALPHSTNEGNEGGGKLGHSVVRPAKEVIVSHIKGRCVRFRWLGK